MFRSQSLTPLLLLLLTACGTLVRDPNWRDARRVDPPPMPSIGQPGGPATTRASLDSTIAALRARLKVDPLDANAAGRKP